MSVKYLRGYRVDALGSDRLASARIHILEDIDKNTGLGYCLD